MLFQSTHPLRGATRTYWIRITNKTFQSTHPLRGATAIHFLRLYAVKFQSTHPLRGATAHTCHTNRQVQHFNPRTPCGVRRRFLPPSQAPAPISIHAPLAGCDRTLLVTQMMIDISIHAPLAGCDDTRKKRRGDLPIFQSTHPLRGATRRGACSAGTRTHFNPRTPCGVRPSVMPDAFIHVDFNPRTPCGVRPCMGTQRQPPGQISIHAPLAGCDRRLVAVTGLGTHFNPRTPCGVRQRSSGSRDSASRFQSTHPLRGATLESSSLLPLYLLFQSTHPLRGATSYQKYWL